MVAISKNKITIKQQGVAILNLQLTNLVLLSLFASHFYRNGTPYI